VLRGVPRAVRLGAPAKERGHLLLGEQRRAHAEVLDEALRAAQRQQQRVVAVVRVLAEDQVQPRRRRRQHAAGLRGEAG
jgi:alpha-D-ribose 1-methylphosphonate 5-triphosphate synthase subunit PhnI